MNTSSPTMTTAACPEWCTLPTGHVGDDELDPTMRWHDAYAGLFELSRQERDGVIVGAPFVSIDSTEWNDAASPAELRQLAADALAAAEWIESQA